MDLSLSLVTLLLTLTTNSILIRVCWRKLIVLFLSEFFSRASKIVHMSELTGCLLHFSPIHLADNTNPAWPLDLHPGFIRVFI